MKKALGKVLFLFYLFPFVYHAMYVDYSSWFMGGYLLMLIVMPYLAFVCSRNGGIKTVILGNILSFMISYYFVHTLDEEHWLGYFTPLSTVQMLVLITLFMLLTQILFVKLIRKRS